MIGYHTIGVREKRLANDTCTWLSSAGEKLKLALCKSKETYGRILEPGYQTLPLHHCPYHPHKFSCQIPLGRGPEQTQRHSNKWPQCPDHS